MAKNFQFFLQKFTNSLPQSFKKKDSSPIPHFPSPQSRKDYITKIDLELLEIRINRVFQELGELTYKQSDKKNIKKNSKKNRLITKIAQLQKEIINKQKVLKG